MNIIIAGGRDFDDYDYLCRCCHRTLNYNNAASYTFLSGGAKGADALGEDYAEAYWGAACFVYEAEWDKYGKGAGYKRNGQMAEEGDCLIAFWDGKSKGTKHMIDIALREGLEVHVFGY